MRLCFRSALQASLSGRRISIYAGPPVPIVSTITSTSNPYIKHCVKLRTNDKYRKQQHRVLLAGQHLIEEQLAKGKQLSILTLFIIESNEVSGQIMDHAGTVVTVEPHVMKKLSGLDTVATVKAVAEVEVQPQVISWDAVQRLLVLDRVQDPGNLGTLLRNAEGLGWDAVFLMGCCDPHNDKAIRAARGSTFQVQHEIGSWSNLSDRLHHHQIVLVSAAMDDSELAAHSVDSDAQSGSSSTDLGMLHRLRHVKVALVLGSEGQGVRPEILHSSWKVSIPMKQSMDSLNVAAAGSMLMLVLSQNALVGVLGQVSSLLRSL